MSLNDYIKFITQQVTTYLDTPSDKRLRHNSRKTTSSAYSNRWLGVLPFAFKTFTKKIR